MASSTCNVYRRALQNYQRFHLAHYSNFPIFPIPSLRLAQFIAYCFTNKLKGTTIQTQLAGLTFFHKVMGLENPAESFLIRKLLAGVLKMTRSRDKRLPVSVDMLRRFMCSLRFIVCSEYDLILFRSMILTAFFALLRVGEMTVTSFGAHNVISVYENNHLKGAFLILHSYKHSDGITAKLHLKKGSNRVIDPVRALYKYLKIRPRTSGPLFINSLGLPISSKTFATIFALTVQYSGLDSRFITPHSLRIGGATLASQLNFTDIQVKNLGRWKSSAYHKYIRPSVLSSP